MNNLSKNLLGWLAVVFVAVLIVFFLASTDKVLNTSTTTNTISFSGEGKVAAKPDIALINFSVVTEAAVSKAAQDENSAKSQSVAEFLKKQNISEKDIKTASYNIYPQYNYPRDRKPEITGYQVTQNYEVKIRDLEKVSAILDGVVTAGVNQITSLSFQIDNQDKLKAQAREMAIDNAKEKARELEDQLDIKLGKIIGFSEGSSGFPPPIFYERSLSAKGIGGDLPEIPTGENEIVVDITIIYQVK